jgi:hypothetical protein
VALPAMMKIANFLPMARPEAIKFSKIILALTSRMLSMKFFSEAIEACPTRTCRRWSECVRPGDKVLKPDELQCEPMVPAKRFSESVSFRRPKCNETPNRWGSCIDSNSGVRLRTGRIVTWLILPVVICLSQRLSHACLSINKFLL